MRADGTLSTYICRPCTETSDVVENALRRDYVQGYLAAENDSSDAGNQTYSLEHANGSQELLQHIQTSLMEPQAESTRDSINQR